MNHNAGRQNERTDSQMQLGIKTAGAQSMLLCNNVASSRTRSQIVRIDYETVPVGTAHLH